MFKYILRFFQLLIKKRSLGINFLLLLILALILPTSGYYSELWLRWSPPAVLGAHFYIPPASPLPKNSVSIPAPILTAKSSVVMDVPSSVIMYQNYPNLALPQASTTKIMTAIVSLESYLLDDVVTVGDRYWEGQSIKLDVGEQVTVENLLYGLLVYSANDAAEVLAAHYPGGRVKFVEEMNNKAVRLNLKNTHFVNPTGIDEIGQYSSALDLARLSAFAIQIPMFSQIVSTKNIVVESIDKKYIYSLSNINTLLFNNPFVKGIKTGWTLLAGECFVGLAEKDGRQVITVVLGSTDRFGETSRLIDWVFNNFVWEIPV